jgi:uncharacterized protein YyaL (SSP411 family)
MKTAPTHAGPLKSNRLALEKSPYLLQHQHNPVDWYAWKEEAFNRARTEKKPIFLSIGYSTCHWCHVMERESFENQAIADFLNKHFVSIKIDREERPDVDRIYMNFVQSTTGHGGWPLNLFLTPDRKPFFGGTYFPPDSRYGRPSFLQVLQNIQQLWESRREDLESSARDLHDRLSEAATVSSASAILPGKECLATAASVLKQQYDPAHGGFGGAPKFPQPGYALLLLRTARRFKDPQAVQMVAHTCRQMARGGMHDQLGGGFARYSVDAEWLVPHFEKMLYDNAQLTQLYLDTFLVTGEKEFAEIARGTLDYVLRDMSHPEGGFFSAEDADSEGHEGKFYCWTRKELAELLDPGQYKVVARYYGITEAGNFVDHSHPQPLPGQNVLHLADDQLSAGESKVLEAARSKMFQARSKRIRPHLDDKVLTSWNGLVLSAFAQAYAILGEQRYLEAAEKNVSFVRRVMWEPAKKTLHHRWRDGERDDVQLVEAYAFYLAGLLALYQATLKPGHLEFAIQLAEGMLEKFFDKSAGGFWQGAADRSDLIMRLKEDYDGAEPSGNSVAVLALLTLGKITGRENFTEAGQNSLRFFSHRLQTAPHAMPVMLQAVDFNLAEPVRAVITGKLTDAEVRRLARVMHATYQPNKVVLGTQGPVEPFAATLEKEGAAPKVFLCTGTECQAPTANAEQITRMLVDLLP